MTSERNRGAGREEGEETVDDRLSMVATGQRGVVSLAQLEGMGLGQRGTSHRAAAGRLHRLHRGVYAVGHRSIGRVGLLRAAILACGEGAVISHSTAAAFWGLRPQWPALIDAIVPCQTGRKIDGIRAHRCRYPGPEEIVERAGVRCTTPARTLVDIAGIFGTSSVRRAVEEAAVRKLLDIPALDHAMEAARGRRGLPALRAIVDEWRAPDGTTPDVRSIFEARALPSLVRIGLEWPDCNRKLRVDGHSFMLDFYWEKRNLIVEADGEATHGTPPAFRSDRRRDQILIAAGFRVTRVTWEDIRDELDETIDRIRRMLESGAGSAAY